MIARYSFYKETNSGWNPTEDNKAGTVHRQSSYCPGTVYTVQLTTAQVSKRGYLTSQDTQPHRLFRKQTPPFSEHFITRPQSMVPSSSSPPPPQ